MTVGTLLASLSSGEFEQNTEKIIRESLGDVWDEAVKALAWALENRGSADEYSALHYVGTSNPYRRASPDSGAS